MNSRMLRFLLVAWSFGWLSSAPLGCVRTGPAVVAPPLRDRTVEQCHRAIREQAVGRVGGPAVVSFDTSETYYVSSALEGVRGGGVIAAGRDRARIHYSCEVDIHSQEVVQADHQWIAAPRSGPDWTVDACQDRIRDEVADRSRNSSVRFEPAETYRISLNREGVRGRGLVKTGDRRERIQYECTVDVRRGEVTRAHYRPLAEPPLADGDAVDLCRREIAAKAEAERGLHAKVSFAGSETYAVSRFERGVRGEAKLQWRTGKERIEYECTVDVRRQRVTAARYLPLEPPQAPSERIIEICQMATRKIAAADHGRNVGVEFETAETFSISERKTGVQGRGMLQLGSDGKAIQYRCAVDHREGKVTDARYRPIDPPPELARRTVDLCYEELRDRVRSDRDDRASLHFETSETYFISNAVEGVRGEGMIRSGRRDRDPIRYECEVNIRRGRVDEARYRYR